MKKQEHAPSQAKAIKKILSQLNIKSIEEILVSDNINVDFLAKSTNIHKTIVIKLLFELQKYLNNPTEYVPTQKYSINLKEVVSQWAQEPLESPKLQKIKDLQVGSSQIIEIIGKANSGKTLFCSSFAYHCIKKGLTVLFIDSNQNHKTFVDFLTKTIGPENKKQLETALSKVLHFQFKTLSQFSILMHNLVSGLIRQKRKCKDSIIEKGVITFIDCLSRIQMADPDTDQQNSTMDFDIIEKIKKMIVTYAAKVSTVVYTNRIQNSFTLFNTFYKNEKHRPRCKNNNAKLWDSIANKTIFVDYSMTPNNEEIKKIHFTKDFPNDIFGFRK